MQVKNIECQIAQAQMRRYLTGEEMPKELVGDLEVHLKNCPDCMAQAQHQRESLSGVLAAKIMGRSTASELQESKGSSIPNRYVKRPAPTSKPVRNEPGKAAVQTPLDILDSPDEQFKTKKKIKKRANYKTLFYSLALAALLVLMSTVFKDPTALFGAKASDLKKDTPPKDSTATDAGTTLENGKIGPTLPPSVTGDDTSQNAGDTDKTAPEKPVVSKKVDDPPPVTTNQDNSSQAAASKDNSGRKVVPVGKDDIIVADSVDGTTVQGPKPKKKPGNSTLKVYPPVKN